MTDEPVPRLSVAAPCYNEAEGIEAVVAEWDAVLATRARSRPRSCCATTAAPTARREVLERLRARFPRLRVVHNRDQRRLRPRALVGASRRRAATYVATIDSDGQFDLADAFELLGRARARRVRRRDRLAHGQEGQRRSAWSPTAA